VKLTVLSVCRVLIDKCNCNPVSLSVYLVKICFFLCMCGAEMEYPPLVLWSVSSTPVVLFNSDWNEESTVLLNFFVFESDIVEKIEVCSRD